jgi:hypothetical protein
MQYEGWCRRNEDIEASADPHARDKLYQFYVGKDKKPSFTLDASPVEDGAPTPSFALSVTKSAIRSAKAVANMSMRAAAARSSSFSSSSSAAAASSSFVGDGAQLKKHEPRSTQKKEMDILAIARHATGPACQTPNRVAELLNDYRKNIKFLDHPANNVRDINVMFIDAELCGKPAVFVVVVQDVAPKQWLRIDYGLGK